MPITDSNPKPSVRLPFVRNWISLAGLIIAFSSIFAFVLLLIFDVFAARRSPYLGILSYVVAPAFLEKVLRDTGPEFAVAVGIALRRLQELD